MTRSSARGSVLHTTASLQVKLQLQEVPHLPNHQEAPSLSPAAVMQAKFQGFIIQQILNIFGEVFDYFILQIFKPVS